MSRNVDEGALLWEPSERFKNRSNLTNYMDWLMENNGKMFSTYEQLWEWSVTEVEEFWLSLWKYFDIVASRPPVKILSDKKMPGAKWFEGATLNYTEQIFNQLGKKVDRQATAIISKSELRPLEEMTWEQLYEQVATFRKGLVSLGVEPGDRVVSYLPNIPETVVAFLACASLGAIWSSSSPDFGSQTVIDRFKQIEPKLLIAADGYRYGGKDYDRLANVREIQREIPTLEHVILLPYLHSRTTASDVENVYLWHEFMAVNKTDEFSYEQVAFEHPLWILYSSGTTGIPKAIVHGQGNIIIEHMKSLAFHMDAHTNDRLLWFTTTGWMIWNLLVSNLLRGTAIVLYDGNPSYPTVKTLWEFVENSGTTIFGMSPLFLQTSKQAGLVPKQTLQLDRLRAMVSTGAPLTAELFHWVYEHVKEDIWLSSASGGTDVCAGFVMGSPLHPVRAGEIQVKALGVKVEAFNEAGQTVLDEVGELVVTSPMPSMPLYFWNDGKNKRYLESYFEVFPGVWTHGDWIKFHRDGGCQIYGRSDSTINRGGIRMGTSEIYSAVEQMQEISDSLIIDLSSIDTVGFMPLFVVLQQGVVLTKELKSKIKMNIRKNCSPRHIPDEIYEITEVPRTLNGKKLEVPIKRILLGMPVEQAANRGSMTNPESLDYFIDFAEDLKNNK